MQALRDASEACLSKFRAVDGKTSGSTDRSELPDIYDSIQLYSQRYLDWHRTAVLWKGQKIDASSLSLTTDICVDIAHTLDQGKPSYIQHVRNAY